MHIVAPDGVTEGKEAARALDANELFHRAVPSSDRRAGARCATLLRHRVTSLHLAELEVEERRVRRIDRALRDADLRDKIEQSVSNPWERAGESDS